MAVEVLKINQSLAHLMSLPLGDPSEIGREYAQLLDAFISHNNALLGQSEQHTGKSIDPMYQDAWQGFIYHSGGNEEVLIKILQVGSYYGANSDEVLMQVARQSQGSSIVLGAIMDRTDLGANRSSLLANVVQGAAGNMEIIDRVLEMQDLGSQPYLPLANITRSIVYSVGKDETKDYLGRVLDRADSIFSAPTETDQPTEIWKFRSIMLQTIIDTAKGQDDLLYRIGCIQDLGDSPTDVLTDIVRNVSSGFINTLAGFILENDTFARNQSGVLCAIAARANQETILTMLRKNEFGQDRQQVLASIVNRMAEDTDVFKLAIRYYGRFKSRLGVGDWNDFEVPVKFK